MMSSSIAHTFSIVIQYMIDHHYVTCINLNKYMHVAFRVRNNKLVQQSSAECLRITLDSAEGDTEEDMSERKRHEQLGNERS